MADTIEDEYLPAELHEVQSLEDGALVRHNGVWLEIQHRKQTEAGEIMFTVYDEDADRTTTILTYVGVKHRARRLKPRKLKVVK